MAETHRDDGELLPWQTSAINLVEHADNLIHTDAGAVAAGFPSALVAGTTLHAYLTHPPAAAWGAAWLDAGWSELRLVSPVFDNETVDVEPHDMTIEATVGGDVRATLAVALSAPAAPQRAVIEKHSELTFDLSNGLGTYGLRAGDDLTIYAAEGRAHPSVWPSLGNSITKEFYVTGPWVHVRSAITHFGFVASDAVVTAAAALVDRFDTRAGERVVLDIMVSAQGRPVARIEHESIIQLA